MAAALAAVPFLMHYLGQERLGVLSLVLVIIGYFGFMGMGRAVAMPWDCFGFGHHGVGCFCSLFFVEIS
jgi:hypothetical protein